MEYNKPVKTVDEQINLLIKRGLSINNPDRCRHYLNNISYFRLSAYTRPYYIPNNEEHLFLPNTSFDDVLNLYIFDRELRLLLLDAIERLEIALRAQITNTLAENHGAKGYLDRSIFDTRYNFDWLISKLEKETNSESPSAERFIVHHRKKYDNPEQLPVWKTLELLTFKEVSVLFSNLRLSVDTQCIEKHFGWKFPILKSWFRSLSDLRNICAHQGRVWNREFGSIPEQPKKISQHWPIIKPIKIGVTGQLIDPKRRLYMQLIVIISLMKAVNPNSSWSNRLISLLNKYHNVSQPNMGFPPKLGKGLFLALIIAIPLSNKRFIKRLTAWFFYYLPNETQQRV